MSQGQSNRRARGLCWLIERMRLHLVARMGVADASYQIIGLTPVRLRHWRRLGRGHLLLPEAALGHCAAKRETYYGSCLLARITLDGVGVVWTGWSRAGGQGLPGSETPGGVAASRGILLLTPKRKNQRGQNAPGWDALMRTRFMNRARRLVETVFAQAKGTFSLERPGARSVWGTLSRVIARDHRLTLAALCSKEQWAAAAEAGRVRILKNAFHIKCYFVFCFPMLSRTASLGQSMTGGRRLRRKIGQA